MGQRKPVTVTFGGSTKTLYYDPETKKTYVDATSSAEPGIMWRMQVEKKMNPTASTESQTTLPTSMPDWYELNRQQGMKYGNPTLTKQEAFQRGFINLTPDERGQYLYNGFINLPTSVQQTSTQQTTPVQGAQTNQGPTGQIQLVKGPDGRWTYKLIGQVPIAQMKAAMEQIRNLNAKLDSQQTTSRWTNLRDTSAIQRFLTMQGYNLEIDGKMGPKTQQALRDWQSKNGLKADGLWGNNTEAAAKRVESTMQAPQSSGGTVESRTTPSYAGTTTPIPNLALTHKIGQDMANGVGIFGNGQLFGSQPLSPLEEAAQYQKRGGCMYKRGKRIK